MTHKIRHALTFGPLAGLIVASQAAAADPCVGASFDRPLPGATGVVTRRADVPSPRFPGVWQEGVISGYGYQIYANGEATIKDIGPEPAWSVSVLCEPGAESCSQTAEGDPPAAALRVADMMGQCFIAPETVKAPLPPAPEPEKVAPETDGWALDPSGSEEPDGPDTTGRPETPDPSERELPPPVSDTPVALPPLPPLVPVEEEVEEAPLADETPPAPCGVASMPEGAPGLTLQRLIVEAGADPGPLDGFPGRRTRAALAEILGPSAAALSNEEAIAALDALLCAPTTE